MRTTYTHCIILNQKKFPRSENNLIKSGLAILIGHKICCKIARIVPVSATKSTEMKQTHKFPFEIGKFTILSKKTVEKLNSGAYNKKAYKRVAFALLWQECLLAQPKKPQKGIKKRRRTLKKGRN